MRFTAASFNRWVWVVAICFLSAGGGIRLYAQSQPNREPSEQIQPALPTDGTVLINGTTVPISATATFNPSSLEPVEFISEISINGRKYHPAKTYFTAATDEGGVSGSEIITWYVHVPSHRHATVRLHSWGVGQDSHKIYEFFDMSKTYQVKCNPKEYWLMRDIHRLFGCCS